MTIRSFEVRLHSAFLGIVNLVLAASGTGCLGFGVLTLFRNGDLATASTAITAGLVLLLASTIDRFEFLKGLGMEARTRQLDKAINQANATLEQIRELAEISSETVVSLNSKVGRWDAAPSPRESYETVRRVRANLKDLGCNDATIHRILAPWVEVTTMDQVNALLGRLRRPLQLAQEDLNKQIQDFPKPIMSGDPAYQGLLDQRNRYGAFEGNFHGGVNTWPVGSHATKLQSFVEEMPLPDEGQRQGLLSIIAPWLPRLAYLAENCDLSDKHAWFALDQFGTEPSATHLPA